MCKDVSTKPIESENKSNTYCTAAMENFVTHSISRIVTELYVKRMVN